MTDERAEDQSYENEGMNRSMVTISLKEYDSGGILHGLSIWQRTKQSQKNHT
jgi:hypothetical protein